MQLIQLLLSISLFFSLLVGFIRLTNKIECRDLAIQNSIHLKLSQTIDFVRPLAKKRFKYNPKCKQYLHQQRKFIFIFNPNNSWSFYFNLQGKISNQ